MKQLNFSRLRHGLYCALTMIMLIAVILPLISSTLNVVAESSLPDIKLLIVVDDGREKPLLTEDQMELIEIKSVSEISERDKNHIAYATSKSIAENENVNIILRDAFINVDARIYVYGGLTIAEFKDILEIEQYSIQTDIYDQNGIIEQKAYMSFSEEQEEGKVEQVICLSNNPNYQSLIVSAVTATYDDLESIIMGHYFDTFYNPMLYATIVQNSFNYRTYAHFSGDILVTTCYLNMDYYLYKIEDELIEDYDYFAIKANVNTVYESPSVNTGEVQCTEIQVQFALPYTSDHFYDFGPASTNKANNINVELGFGDTGIAGNISFNFSPGNSPTINTTYNSVNRTILWKVSRYWFFGASLNNALYPFGASWASSGRLAAINISTYLVVEDSCKSDWNEVQVRFSY